MVVISIRGKKKKKKGLGFTFSPESCSPNMNINIKQLQILSNLVKICFSAGVGLPPLPFSRSVRNVILIL